MVVVKDVNDLGEAGFDKYLIRMDYNEGGQYLSHYINPNTLVEGVLGQSGIMYLGTNLIKIDGNKKQIVINDGANDRVLIGKF